MMLTPAGMKKKAMLPKRKSDFSRMWSTRTARRQSRVKSSTMAATLAGNGKGSRDSMICPTQQIEKIMAI